MTWVWVFVAYSAASTVMYQHKPMHIPADVTVWGVYDTQKECEADLKWFGRKYTNKGDIAKCVEVPK